MPHIWQAVRDADWDRHLAIEHEQHLFNVCDYYHIRSVEFKFKNSPDSFILHIYLLIIPHQKHSIVREKLETDKNNGVKWMAGTGQCHLWTFKVTDSVDLQHLVSGSSTWHVVFDLFNCSSILVCIINRKQNTCIWHWSILTLISD